jgi:bilirubin oxidase
MDRRSLLLTGGGAALLAACGGGDSMHGGGPMGGSGPMSPTPLGTTPALPAGLPLLMPARLANRSTTPGLFDAELVAAPVEVALGPGARTQFWAFNGTVPGPLIEVTEGDRVRITFSNRLPSQDSTIHWHGMPVPAAQDGNPMNPVPPGSSRVYDFTLPPDCAAPYWYHPHPHRVTHEQVFRGLAGAFIVKPRSDPLPAGVIDTPLLVTDLRLDAAYQVAPNIAMDYVLGREGDVLLINGGLRPVLTTAPGAVHRLRLFNMTNARYLRLAIDDLSMTLIGTDGGLLAAPRSGISELLLAPGERAEVLASFVRDTVLRTLAYDRGSMMMGMGTTARASDLLLTVRVAGAAAAPLVLPPSLRTVLALSAPTARKRLVLGPTGMMAGAGMGAFTINGRSFDPARIDETSQAGAVELWEVANPTNMDHPFHLHGTQFQVAARVRNGVATPEPLLAWKDTVNVARGETVQFLVRQNEPGLRMYHCHILEHEDQGMMGVVAVV